MLDMLDVLDILDRKCETITVAPNSDGNGRQILQQIQGNVRREIQLAQLRSLVARNAVWSS